MSSQSGTGGSLTINQTYSFKNENFSTTDSQRTDGKMDSRLKLKQLNETISDLETSHSNEKEIEKYKQERNELMKQAKKQQDFHKQFKEWIKDGNAIEVEKDGWLEQSTQYYKLFTTDQLYKFFVSEYMMDEYESNMGNGDIDMGPDYYPGTYNFNLRNVKDVNPNDYIKESSMKQAAAGYSQIGYDVFNQYKPLYENMSLEELKKEKYKLNNSISRGPLVGFNKVNFDKFHTVFELIDRKQKESSMKQAGFDSDESVATELALYITNDGDLYRQQVQPIIKNLARKKIKGVYDEQLALKLWAYLIEAGAKKYSHDFGGTWHESFPKYIRQLVAEEVADHYAEEIDGKVAELSKSKETPVEPNTDVEKRIDEIMKEFPEMDYQEASLQARSESKEASMDIKEYEEGVDEEFKEPQDGDYMLSDSGSLGSKTSVNIKDGKFIGEFNSQDEAEEAILKDMELNQYWPNVWYVNDHGNLSTVTIEKQASAKKAKATERYVVYGSGPDMSGRHVDKVVDYNTGEELVWDDLLNDLMFGDDMPVEFQDYKMSLYFTSISNVGGLTLAVDYDTSDDGSVPDEAVEKVNDYLNTIDWVRYDEMPDREKAAIDEKVAKSKTEKESSVKVAGTGINIEKSLIAEFTADLKDKEEVETITEEIKDSFQEGSSSMDGTFTADGQDYVWYADEDAAEREALSQVKDMLDSEPELFNKDFIQQHLFITDTDRRIIAGEESDNTVDENWDDDENLDQANMKSDYEEFQDKIDSEEDETKIAELEKKQEEMLDKAKEENKSRLYDDIYEALKDPIKYFVDDHGMYSLEDLMKASFISIDTNEAAEEAVNTDGWAHFLSSYDGDYETTKDGVVYFKQ